MKYDLDLKKQLKKKVEKERRAAAEKSELESIVSNYNKVAGMMSMNVKKLQWQIWNNYELPVGGIFANKKVERDEDALSVKKLSENFILCKFLCCLDLKRFCPS